MKVALRLSEKPRIYPPIMAPGMLPMPPIIMMTNAFRLKKVDFPAPFGPMIAVIFPFSISKSTLSTAVNPPKDFVRLFMVKSIFNTKRLQREEKACREKAFEVLEFVGLTDQAYKPVAGISQEAQKRTAFALALATDPEIVFLDEPAAGVNPDETDGLAELMRKMVSKGITVCLIEHKMQMIMSLADKIMVLNYGKKIAEGTPDEIKKNEVVIEAYLGGVRRNWNGL